ncbi:protein kinase domain-containing protein [Streptomyces flavalbus]|uniref:non-specific serine/threonine protein kinase n=1 Tax=Streptomyces flavalbus TaxID=2665155 RepID=A0ABW2WCN7_9ACTN
MTDGTDGTDGAARHGDGPPLAGRYRLVEPLGSGATGTVWRAYDEQAGREVAVKEPRLPGDPEDEAYRRAAHRLYREARAAARVDHPSAVSVHDVVVEEGDGADGPPWIVMELVRGETLRALIGRGPLDPPEAARIGLAVLGALRAAHSVGIVHRDLKPANVLVEAGTGRVVLTDFGFAGDLDGDAGFVAPERAAGRGAGPASDLWSLGALLDAAVAGGGPLEPLLVRLLDRDPARRPEPAEVAAGLAAVAGVEVPEATRREAAAETGTAYDTSAPDLGEPRPSPDPGAPRPRHPLRHPAALPLLSALLLTAVLLGAALLPSATADTANAGVTWAEHQEPDMDAVLALPVGYEESERRGGAADPPRLVVYTDTETDADAPLRVRLTQWDTAPRSPLSQARRARAGWDGARTRYTRTSVQGQEAVVADTTYLRPDGSPARALELLFRTGDRRMYQLRVDMPRGAAHEREGTAVFEGARDRLEIGGGGASGPG